MCLHRRAPDAIAGPGSRLDGWLARCTATRPMARPPARTTGLLYAGIGICLVVMSIYLAARLLSLDIGAFTIPGLIMASWLLTAELFVAFHGMGYLASIVKATRARERAHTPMLAPYTSAPVAVLVASFNESEEVLEETLASASAMDYPNFQIYLLDDSTREENRAIAARVAARYRAQLVTRTNRAGYKAGAINDLLPSLTQPFIAVLDADQRPIHSWLREIVPQLEADPTLAFVQAPQVYVNHDGKPVALAAFFQQAVFYEYICEGKNASNAMFCCGSNVVLRREALLSIGTDVDGRRHYFDETSITEDFATSLRLHAKGWRSRYVNRTYVVGMGPETLAAYFTQQTRWAMGTVGVFRKMVRAFVRNPRSLSPGQWWEYFLSGNYYFIGFMNFLFMVASVGFLVFGIRPVHLSTTVYLSLFIPYFVFSFGVFLFGMRVRNYPFKGTWIGTALAFGGWWTFMKASITAALTAKQTFSVTPKGTGGSVPLKGLIPQVTMFALCCMAVVSGLLHLGFDDQFDLTYVVTASWAAYHATLTGTLLFYFNRPVEIRPRQPVFEPVAVAPLVPRTGQPFNGPMTEAA